MKKSILLLSLVAAVFGSASSLACSWVGPDEATGVNELAAVLEITAKSEVSNVLSLDYTAHGKYEVAPVDSTPMCPKGMKISESFTVVYTLDNGLRTVCSTVVEVSRTSGLGEIRPTVYKVDGLKLAKCTR